MTKPNGLYPKIARIMGRLNRLPKTGRNAHFKYDFVTDADVADAVRKELATENVAFFASMISATQEGKHTVATFEFIFACGDTGETQTCMWVGEANDSQDKGLTKAATSAEKYFLLKTFMLSAGDGADDPDSSENQSPAPRQQSAPDPSELDEHFGSKQAPQTKSYTIPLEIVKYWRDNIGSALYPQLVTELVEKGINIGAMIYPVAKGRLGYADDKVVKSKMAVDSLKEYPGTLEGLCMALIKNSEANES